MPITGVMPLPAVTNSALARRAGAGRTNSPVGLVEVDERAGRERAHDVVADLAVRDRLDGDRDAAVGSRTGEVSE